MKIKVSLEAYIDFDIDVNNSILDEVARHYDGDFKEWAMKHYKDYFDKDEMEICNEDCRFDKQEAKELLSNAREVIGAGEDNLTQVAINRTKFKKSKIYDTIDESVLKKIKFDLETIKKVVAYTDDVNPNFRLNYIHMYKNIIEATDAKRLIRYKSDLSIENEMFFAPYFIEAMENGGECFIDEHSKLILKYNGCFYKGFDSYLTPEFPNIDRVIASSKSPKLSLIPYSDVEINLVKIYKDEEAVEITHGEIKIYIKKLFWDEAIKENIEQIGVTDKKSPLYLCGDKFEIIIMPLLVDDDDIKIMGKYKGDGL